MIDADTERDETPDIERELEHHRLVTLLQTSALAGDLLAQSKHKMSPMEPERMEDDHWSFPRFGSGLASHARPNANACSWPVILLESPDTTADDSRLEAVCTIADQTSTAGTTRSDTCLPKFSATETVRVNSLCS